MSEEQEKKNLRQRVGDKIEEVREVVETKLFPEEEFEKPNIPDTEYFLETQLPEENPSHYAYISSYATLATAKESAKGNESKQLLTRIELGLPYTRKGFYMIQHQYAEDVLQEEQIEEIVELGGQRIPVESVIDEGLIYFDRDSWKKGYPAYRLWRLMNKEVPERTDQSQPTFEERVTTKFLEGLYTSAIHIHRALLRQYQEALGRESRGIKTEAQQTNQDILSKQKEKLVTYWESLPSDADELEELTKQELNNVIFFESLLKMYTNPESLFVDFEKRFDFWMSEESEPIMYQLLNSPRKDFKEIYYRILKAKIEYANKIDDPIILGRIGTRHALRVAGADPRAKDFTDVDFWRGIHRPENLPTEKRENPHFKYLYRYKNVQANGFTLLSNLSKGSAEDIFIYNETMTAFLDYLGLHQDEVEDSELSTSFFLVQMAFDKYLNLPESERVFPIQNNTLFYILRRYMWLMYGPEVMDEETDDIGMRTWEIKKRMLTSGAVHAYRSLFEYQQLEGQDSYDIWRGLFLEIKEEIQREYTGRGWELINFLKKDIDNCRSTFRRAFQEYNINIPVEEEDLFFLAILLGTIEFSSDAKNREDMIIVTNTAKRYLTGTDLPTAYQEQVKKIEESLVKWRFIMNSKDPSNPSIEFHNDWKKALTNLSILWGRGYGVKVQLTQEGLMIQNPLHTQGEEKVESKDGRFVRTRANNGGRDEVLVPWDVIAKATPQFDYIPWADGILKYIAKYRANLGRRDLDRIADLVAQGAAVIKFEAAGSGKIYELPPLPHAQVLATELQKIARVMANAQAPRPVDLIKKLNA